MAPIDFPGQGEDRGGYILGQADLKTKLSGLDAGLSKLIGTQGTISKLEAGLTNLANALEKLGVKGLGVPGHVSGTFAGYSVNQHAGGLDVASTMPSAVAAARDTQGASQAPSAKTNQTAGPFGWTPSGKQLAYGGAVYGLNQIGGAWSSRAAEGMATAPFLQGAASFTGIPSNAGFSATSSALRQGNMIRGTTGSIDAATAAMLASQLTGSNIVQRGSRAQGALGGYSAMLQTNPAMAGGLTAAAGAYGQLVSGGALAQSAARGLPTFQGIGGVQNNFVQTAYGVAMQAQFGNRRARPGVNQFEAFWAENGAPFQQLSNLYGSPEAARSVVGTARAQVTFQNNGGRNWMDPASNKDLRRAGVSSSITEAMRSYDMTGAKNELAFTQSQQTNIAAQTNLQRDIRDGITKIVNALGAGGGAMSAMSRGVGALTSSPLGTVGAFALFEKLLGGKGGAGALKGPGIGGLARAGGMAGGGLLAGQALDAAGAPSLMGDISRGAGFGAALGSLIPIPGLNWATGGLGGAAGGALAHFFGDPPPDTNTIEHQSNVDAGEVTGLNPTFRHDLAAMFRANPRLRLNSGYRSPALQRKLYNNYKLHGGPEVAPPGGSLHEKGFAADIGPASEYAWLRANAGKYGLVNHKPEPWHWELAGASSSGNRTNYGVEPNSAAVNAGTGAGSGGSGGRGMSSGSAAGSFFGSSAGKLAAGFFGTGTVQGSVFAAGRNMGGGGAGGGGTGGDGGGAGTSGTGPAATGSAAEWDRSFLNAIGAPTSDSNMRLLRAWQTAETGGGMPDKAHFNLLATTMRRPGSYSINSAGVQSFPSMGVGAEANAAALMENHPGYAAILADLRRGNVNPGQIASRDLQGFTTWGTGRGVGKALGIGDPPVSGGMGGGSHTNLSMRSSPVQAVFHINVQQASPEEAERLARFAWKRIAELQNAYDRRGV